MTATLRAANAAWTGLAIVLWTKRLWETHYARLDCLALNRTSREDKTPITTGRGAHEPVAIG